MPLRDLYFIGREEVGMEPFLFFTCTRNYHPLVTIIFLNFWTDRSDEQSDQVLHCLPCPQHIFQPI